MRFGPRISKLNQLPFPLQGWHSRKAFRRRPGLDSRAAPGGIDQPNRHTKLLVQFASKEVGGSRKTIPSALSYVCGLHTFQFASMSTWG